MNRGRGAKKGENRSKIYNEKNINSRINRIKTILEEVRRAKFYFDGITSLGEYIVSRINADIEKLETSHDALSSEGESLQPLFKRGQGKIAIGTLIGKKSKYRDILVQHISSQKAENAIKHYADEVFDLKLTISNLKQELKAKDNFITKRLGQGQNNLQQEPSPDSTRSFSTDAAVIDACHKAILNLVENSEGIYSFDNGSIINLAKDVDNIVVSTQLVSKTALLNSKLFNDGDTPEKN